MYTKCIRLHNYPHFVSHAPNAHTLLPPRSQPTGYCLARATAYRAGLLKFAISPYLSAVNSRANRDDTMGQRSPSNRK